MNKRITSIVLSLVMLFTMLATAVPVLAATPVELKVTADTTSANPGDTINYKVSIGAVTDMGGLEFKLDIPSGLTIDDGSISIPDGLETTIDSDGAIIVPTSSNSYYWCYSAQLTGYTGISDLVILTFSCKVDDGITGTKTVSIKDVILIDQSVNDMDFNVTGSDVNVTPAPKPATGISLNKSTLELTVGENETLVATVEPADTTDTVVWTSSKESVATVDNTGEVTAVAPGEAIITAKAGSVSATCTVKVSCAHTLQTVPAKESNCTEKGWDEYQECTLCGALFDMSGGSRSDIPYRALDTNAHTFGSWIDEVPANCTNTGTKEHKDCTLCSKHFDNAGVEITDLTIPTNDDHDFDMSEWGYQGDDGHAHVCTRNPDHKDGVVPHTSSGSATETEDEVCTICDYVITPATGHVCASRLTKVEAKPADCTNPGNKEHYKCECGNLYKDADAQPGCSRNGNHPSDLHRLRLCDRFRYRPCLRQPPELCAPSGSRLH